MRKGVISEKGYSSTGKITSPSSRFLQDRSEGCHGSLHPEERRRRDQERQGGLLRRRRDILGVDPKTREVGRNLTVKGMDMEGATKRLLGGQGKVAASRSHGQGNGHRGNGGHGFRKRPAFSERGKRFRIQRAQVGVELGRDQVQPILASFNLDGRNIFLMPGSRVPPPWGTMSTAISASGVTGMERLSRWTPKCTGDINVRALNAFRRIVAYWRWTGILSPTRHSCRIFFPGFGGMSVKDFETSFNVKGTWDSPLLTDIKVTLQFACGLLFQGPTALPAKMRRRSRSPWKFS